MWAGTSTFRVGPLYLGVRSSTEDVQELVRRALAAHLVDDVEAPANLSVQIDGGTARKARSRGLHFLYANATQVVRSRDPRRVVRGLLTYLSAGLPDETPHLRVYARTLVRDGRAVLVPANVGPWLQLVERRLGVRGFRVVDAPWAWVDPVRNEVVVPRPGLAVDWPALDDLERVAPRSGPPDPGVDYGAYPLGGWAFSTPGDHVGPLSRAQAVLWAAGLVYDREKRGARRTLEDLAAIVAGLDPVGVAWSDEPELVAALDAVPVAASA